MAHVLRDRILKGDLAPGTRLVETAIAEAFGTSRGPVREALGRLAAAGLVTVHPRRGAYVTSFDAADIEEIYLLRIALETVAAERAATRGNAADWDEMARALEDLTKALDEGDGNAVSEADMRFHRTLVRAARQPRLATAWEAFADQTLLLLEALTDIGPEVQAAPGGHAEVLEALRQGDGERAAARVREHLTSAREVMIDRFGGPRDNEETT